MNEEWVKEQQRVYEVHKVIEQKMRKLDNNMGELKGDVIELRKTFWDDVTINFDNPSEAIETLTSIKQQAELLGERERTHGQSNKLLRQLYRLQQTPYFGRIDFKEQGEKESERIYIGIASLMDEQDEHFLIYDWRAPISSLYYDYGPGEAAYQTPSGEMEGVMELKRQFIIEGYILKGMFDTGITIGDNILQEVLGGNASTQMKSIVATIQREQNQIIRNDKRKYLIVQGVAGSGKTSAALQRVAYLLYRYRNTITSENIMLFSPNPLFNSYVATVLPELGEENMEQTTYQQYIKSRLSRHFLVEEPFEQMEYMLTEMNEPRYDIRLKSIRLKASIRFKEYIDSYILFLSKEGMLFKNIKFRGQTILSAQEISKLFYSFDPSISIPNRLKLVTDEIIKILKEMELKERDKDWALEEAGLLDKSDYLDAFKHVQKSGANMEDTFHDAELEERILVNRIVTKYFKPIKQAVNRLDFLNVRGLYRQLIAWKDAYSLHEDWEDIQKATVENLNENQLTYEDATAYLYLQDQLEGRKSNTIIRHLIIDEAQDYSPFQFEFLKQLFPNSRLTILGDVNQAIYAHSVHAPTLLDVEMEGTEKIVLTKSYRSTRQIVEFTKHLVAKGDMIEPFNRNGSKPVVTEIKDSANHLEGIIKKVNEWNQKGHKTIAVICKTAKESNRAYELLKTRLSVRLIDSRTSSYEKGVVILPAYLAKGIEFDAVLIFNASESQYSREMERNLFYAACTRAMHELELLSIGKLTPFMKNVPRELYTIE